MEKICENCGEPFTPRWRNRNRPYRFCSAACYHAFGRDIRKATVKSQRMRKLRDDHPLSTSPGARVAVSRVVLYDRIGEGPHFCHWCGAMVEWMPGAGPRAGALIADHLNWDRNDDSPENLVAACANCNAHRTRTGDRRRIEEGEATLGAGTTRTRAVDRICEWCGEPFLAVPAQVRQGRGRFCSRSCARRASWAHRRASNS